LYDGIRSTIGSVDLIELDSHINDLAFSESAAQRLLKLIAESLSNVSWHLRKK